MSNIEEKKKAFERILTIMDELRAQCPWDQKQTVETLRHLTIEETYELSDAIVQNDWKGIKEEVGDLLLHIVFYAKLGEEKELFDMASIINTLCDKLISRHPHIYGDVKVADEEEVKRNWEQLKMKEGRSSVMGGVPASLPSLIKAVRIQEKAKQVGFEWDDIEDVWSKVTEELGELREEVKTNHTENIQKEYGDVLFALVNYGRFLNLDPEYCLELSNQKFLKRFRYIEEQAALANKKMADMTLGEMDKIWNEAKEKGIA
jgi:XTP/dITP diphosphohydrolase